MLSLAAPVSARACTAAPSARRGAVGAPGAWSRKRTHASRSESRARSTRRTLEGGDGVAMGGAPEDEPIQPLMLLDLSGTLLATEAPVTFARVKEV